jgi:GT2 family glycosyltransferase
MREFDAQGNTIQSYVTGEEGWVADNILLMKPIIVGSGGSIMIRREAFESVGGFNERLSVGEDWEFCYRVARKFKIGFVPEVLFHYRPTTEMHT